METLHSSVVFAVLLALSCLWIGTVFAVPGNGHGPPPWAGPDDVERFFPQLNNSHFQQGLQKLIHGQGKQQTLSLFTQRTVVPADANKNAAAIQYVLQGLSEDQADMKLNALVLSLVNVSDVNSINALQNYSANNLLGYFLTNIAKLDSNALGAALGTSGKAYRSLILGLNALTVSAHNNATNTSKLELNHLSILDASELQNFKGYILDQKKASNVTGSTSVNASHLARDVSALQPPPSNVNWVQSGYVGPVQNQGTCGSCWAFTAAAVMESRLAISGRANLTSLSEQQLVSCSNTAGNFGCAGGSYEAAWKYVQMNGIVPDSTYPYVNAETTQTSQCDNDVTTTPVVTAAPFNDQAPINSELSMMNAVASGGPIAIAIATPTCFVQYASGILTQDDCPCYNGPSSIDHAVMIVGYGTSPNGVDYWLVQNSWGPNWGTAGYVMLQRGVGPMGMCGLLTDPKFPKSVSLSPECQAANPPPYCGTANRNMMYSNINATTGQTEETCYPTYAGQYPDNTCSSESGSITLPIWAWVLIGVAAGLSTILLVCVTGHCCRRCAWFNIFPKPKAAPLPNEKVVSERSSIPNQGSRPFQGEMDEEQQQVVLI